MNNHVSQKKLEDVLIAIWGGKSYSHWQMVSSICFGFSLLFKNADNDKFLQCFCLYQVATVMANECCNNLKAAA